MKTKNAALMYLVWRGVPQNLAKASVDQAYKGAPEGSDQMYGYAFDDPDCANPVPVEMNEESVWLMHEIINDSLTFIKGGIAVFDVLTYDMNGDPLSRPTLH